MTLCIFLLFVTVKLLSFGTVQSQELQCFVQGECTKSIYIKSVDAENEVLALVLPEVLLMENIL